jgi:hypothetical protein
LVRNLHQQDPLAGPDAAWDEEWSDNREDLATPSLPVILVSSACGIGGGVLALYATYGMLGWVIEISAGVATLVMLFSLGISGALLSTVTGSRAAPANILFSCGVIVLAAFFLGLCTVGGALLAALFVMLY